MFILLPQALKSLATALFALVFLSVGGIFVAQAQTPMPAYKPTKRGGGGPLKLIYWQAAKLYWKGASFRHRPAPPADEVTR